MSRKSPRQLEDARRLAERAAEWVTVLPEASAEERAEFVKWIQASPLHLEEFLLASTVVRGLDQADLGAIAQAQGVAAADVANVVHLSPSAVSRATETARPSRRSPLWRMAAAVGGIAVVAAVIASVWFGGPEAYETGIGEQRTLHLSDGSVIQLNVGSRVEVRLDERVRDLRLVSGEAMFKVGRDPQRPFRVYTQTTVIQALGTEFNVRRRLSGTTVSVIEGLVQISAGDSKPRAAGATNTPLAAAQKLGAGEEIRIGTDGRIEQRVPIDVVTVAAWRHNRLDFRAEKLIDIAAEFNRYNEAPQIEVDDEAVGARRYSGVFDANNPRALADFLRDDSTLLVEERNGSIVVRNR